ncbi:hypothetical protein B484DRAFT_433259 [Ochromonadaceae sp. CCMP2298]|nr:hypothetical protein B484DRAFT_433259 [Ochromonadaceae sp. CCMP2298]
MVSIFEGQLTRTWFYTHQDKKHVLNLYHDTISGVRSALLDYQEIHGSLGNSSLLMDSRGHRIFFTIPSIPNIPGGDDGGGITEQPGYLEIRKEGWTGFAYSCVICDVAIPEATEGVAAVQEVVFKIRIPETTFTQDEMSEHPLAWYVLRTERLRDGVTTSVHRRFREFAELNSQVKQNMKGHHLREALPPMPAKPTKAFTDHRDPVFIQERCQALERYVTDLVAIPHVSSMVCVKAFLGIMDQVGAIPMFP